MRNIRNLIQSLAYEFSLISPARHGAALAYYGVFALPPVFFIALEIAVFILGDPVSNYIQQVGVDLRGILGPDIVETIQDLVASTAEQTTEDTTLLTIIGVLGLLYVGAGAFAQLKFSLNAIWDVPPERQIGILPFIIARLLGIAVVLGLGFVFVVLVLLNLFVDTILNAFNLPPIFRVASYLVFVGMIVLTFALLYRFLPDIKMVWKDVWSGAIVAGVLIGLGLALVFWVLQNTHFSSALAATGTFVVILVSINYVAQIFLFGAVVSKVYSHMYGSRASTPAGTPPALNDIA
jgi:membrane protein